MLSRYGILRSTVERLGKGGYMITLQDKKKEKKQFLSSTSKDFGYKTNKNFKENYDYDLKGLYLKSKRGIRVKSIG